MMAVPGVVVIALHALVATQINAAEPESLRLFYGLSSSEIEGRKSGQSNSSNIKKQISVVNSSSDGARSTASNPSAPSDAHKPQGNNKTYHYNGFISSVIGDYYFINGTRITELSSVELVSSDNAGRSLRLRTDKGQAFTIFIGETKLAVPERSSVLANASANRGAL